MLVRHRNIQFTGCWEGNDVCVLRHKQPISWFLSDFNWNADETLLEGFVSLYWLSPPTKSPIHKYEVWVPAFATKGMAGSTVTSIKFVNYSSIMSAGVPIYRP